MIRNIGLSAVLLVVAGCASHPFTRPFQDWTPENTHWQMAYSTAHCMDWAQTRKIAGSEQYYETNFVLGRDPSRTSVDLYMGATLLLQVMVPAVLKPEYRQEYQKVWTQLEVGTVAHNFQIGIQF